MAVLIATLGFDWSHVVAAANRSEHVDKIILLTADKPHPKAEQAIKEVELYGKRLGVPVEVARVNVDDVWTCVEGVREVFMRHEEMYLDVGGGVRALSLCALIAALLAVQLGARRIVRAYTQAEHLETIVEVDLRPLLYAQRFADPRSSRKRQIMLGEAPEGRYDRQLLREYEEYGLHADGKPTAAGRAIASYLRDL